MADFAVPQPTSVTQRASSNGTGGTLSNPVEQPPLKREHSSHLTGSTSTQYHEDWRATIKRHYLSGIGDNGKDHHAKSCRGAVWRWLIRIARLPWTAIVLVAVSIALISVFIVFIVNGPSGRGESVTIVNGTQVVAPSSSLVTIQCETDVSKEECERRARDRVSAQDFQQAMTETHLFTTLIIFWLAATIFFVIKAMRTRRRNRYLESLPRSSIPVWSDLNQQPAPVIQAPTLTQASSSASTNISSNVSLNASAAAANAPLPSSTAATSTTNIAAAPTSSAAGAAQQQQHTDTTSSILASKLPVHSEMERSVALLRGLRTYDPVCAFPADANWGWKSRWKGTHFPTTVRLSSYHFVETKAMEYDPNLRIRKDQTIRDWLRMLKRQFPTEQISHAKLDSFLDFYERARFGEDPITEQAWLEGMSYVYSIGEAFEQLRNTRPLATATRPAPVIQRKQSSSGGSGSPPSTASSSVYTGPTATTHRTSSVQIDRLDLEASPGAMSTLDDATFATAQHTWVQTSAVISPRSSSSSSSGNEQQVAPFDDQSLAVAHGRIERTSSEGSLIRRQSSPLMSSSHALGNTSPTLSDGARPRRPSSRAGEGVAVNLVENRRLEFAKPHNSSNNDIFSSTRSRAGSL